jgi:hypothetical protein
LLAAGRRVVSLWAEAGLKGVVRGRVEGGALGEYACPGDVVELEPDAFWVSEGERVIARRPGPFLWRTHHVRAYALQK